MFSVFEVEREPVLAAFQSLALWASEIAAVAIVHVQLVHGFCKQELQKIVEFGVYVFASWELRLYAIFWDHVRVALKGNVRVDGTTFLKLVTPPRHSGFAERAVFVFDDVFLVEFPASHVCDDGGDGVIDQRVDAIVGERIVGSIIDGRSKFGPVVV